MRVLVAVIGKPFGVRGEVTIRSHSDELENRLVPGAPVYLAEATDDSLTLESVRLSPGGGVLALVGVQTREAAEDLRGCELWVSIVPNTRPESDDEWYAHQLVGLPCVSPDGAHLGEVVAVEAHPAHDTLVVRSDESDVMVPFVKEIVPAVSDTAVTIVDPGGLFPSE